MSAHKNNRRWIGIDNSEVINLEVEREVQRRNKYLANLADNKPISEDQEDSEDDMDGSEQHKEDRVNEKLLKRLYKAAAKDIEQDQGNTDDQM